MKEIKITQNKIVFIDDEDYEKINQYKWVFSKKQNGTGYATHALYLGYVNGKSIRKTIFMHRIIMDIVDPKYRVDHINGNKLDNRKCNLRAATDCQNSHNRTVLSPKNTSGYRGVTWDKHSNKWMAQLYKNNKRKNLGRFENIIDAAMAFDKAAKEAYGDFCGKINFPEENK